MHVPVGGTAAKTFLWAVVAKPFLGAVAAMPFLAGVAATTLGGASLGLGPPMGRERSEPAAFFLASLFISAFPFRCFTANNFQLTFLPTWLQYCLNSTEEVSFVIEKNILYHSVPWRTMARLRDCFSASFKNTSPPPPNAVKTRLLPEPKYSQI